ncbi:MAG: hypothetical protein IPH97_00545 [Ignavibacteriales bacterium]|nr:hypothetical protein [Ignavibacteriales bacterium]
MKYLLSLVLLTTLNVISLCQVKPEAFIGMLPAIPGNACADDIDDKNIFFDKLDSMSELIENELANREEESDADSEELENEAMKNLANKYGLSQEELEQLQNDENLSEEEQEELINKVMKKKDDVSLKEVKNLDKLDEEGTEAWSEALGDQKMAEIQYDSEKNEEQQLELKSSYELGVLRKHLSDSLKAIESKFAQQFDEIDKDPDQEKMLANIMMLSEEANNLVGEGKKTELDAKVNELESEMDAYCRKFTPKYLEVLRRYESYTKSCLPVCYRLEKIIAQHTKLQTGVEMKYNPGYLGIKKISDYSKKLRGAYKYNLKKTI